MAKKGGLTKRNGVAQRTDLTLTPEIAQTFAKILREGGSLFPVDAWEKNTATPFETSKGIVEVKPWTYDQWMRRLTIIPGTNTVFKQYLNKAKEDGWVARHKRQQDAMVREAQAVVKKLQSIPLGTESKIKRKSYRFREKKDEDNKTIKGEFERVPAYEGVEIVSMEVDPRMVSEQRRGAEFILERLDPAYSTKAENKNLNVMISLKDLREAKQKMDAQKPDVAYEQ